MGFRQLREDVARAERRLETRALRARTNWRVLGTTWREAWTPPRLLVAGLAGGLLIALSRPLGRLGKAGKAGGLRSIPLARWIQLATSVSGLVTALRARHAAESAQHAADDAGEVAEEVADTVDAATGAAPGGTRGGAPGPVPGSARAPEPVVAGSVSNARRRPDPPWTSEPRAAEAATEVSERQGKF